MCWVPSVQTLHPSFEGLLPPNGIKPTLFQNVVSIVSGLQVLETTLSLLKTCGWQPRKTVSITRKLEFVINKYIEAQVNILSTVED